MSEDLISIKFKVQSDVQKKTLIRTVFVKLSQGNFTWLCKLRTCNMKIPIETGRWVNIPQEKRLCKFCNDGIGDEFHYLFI